MLSIKHINCSTWVRVMAPPISDSLGCLICLQRIFLSNPAKLEMMFHHQTFSLRIFCTLEEVENVDKQYHQLSQLSMSVEAGT